MLGLVVNRQTKIIFTYNNTTNHSRINFLLTNKILA